MKHVKSLSRCSSLCRFHLNSSCQPLMSGLQQVITLRQRALKRWFSTQIARVCPRCNLSSATSCTPISASISRATFHIRQEINCMKKRKSKSLVPSNSDRTKCDCCTMSLASSSRTSSGLDSQRLSVGFLRLCSSSLKSSSSITRWIRSKGWNSVAYLTGF